MADGTTTMWEQVIDPKQGDLAPPVAEYFLSLGFPPSAHARYAELSTKANDGGLTYAEQLELQELVSINTFLTTVQSKARMSLKRRGSAA